MGILGLELATGGKVLGGGSGLEKVFGEYNGRGGF